MASALSAFVRAWHACLFLLLCGVAVHAQTATDPLPTPTVGSTAQDFSVSVATPPLIVQRGDSVTLGAIVGGLGGFASPVTLSIAGPMPSGFAVTFEPATVTPISPKPTWPATIQTNIVIDTGLAGAAAAAGATTAGPGFVLAALPLLLAAGLIGWRRRGVRLVVAALLFAALPLAYGCGSGIHSTIGNSGSFVLTVKATASTGQQHTVPLLIRVSQ